ncbi:MAG TPA: sialate O-acetylesterase, partial [Arthrobacter sp.]|nr:sialate O-acetylesterase [Arthrobacter sp.]
MGTDEPAKAQQSGSEPLASPASPSRRTLFRRAAPIIAVGLGSGALGAGAASAAARPGSPLPGNLGLPSDEDIARLIADPESATHRALANLLNPSRPAGGQAIQSAENVAGAAAGNGRTDPRKSGADVVLLLGQSNMQGSGLPYDPAIDIKLEGIDQFAGSGPHSGTVIPAADALFHVTQNLRNGALTIGPGMEFARQLWLNQPADRKVLLVPAALGGTSITGNADYSWDPYNTKASVNLARRGLDACVRALALNPSHRLVAILWHQGESDALPKVTQDWYRRKLLQIIDLYRAQLGPVPFLIGGMVPEWIAADKKIRGRIDA